MNIKTNKHFLLLLIACFLSLSFLVSAKEERPDSDLINPSPATSPERSKTEDKLRQDLKNKQDKLKSEAEETRKRLKKEAEAKREDLKKRKEEFDRAIKIKKEKVKEEIETERESLKIRLEKIKDERKKESVEKIDQRIDALNEKMMRHFSSVLNKLEDMLIKITERADRASVERGLDVSSVRSSIDNAHVVIASARSAIESQLGKTYAVSITTEENLRIDVGKTRQVFGADLAKVRDSVKSAHSAVKDAVVALAQISVKPKPSPLIDSE